jgi:putative Mn2+ efflux pump MntP
MGFGGILLLALGLSMDAAAVSAARGVALTTIETRHVVLVAVFFGGAQALMPVAGWMIGAGIGPLVEAWDHWIALALLSFIGGKMLKDGFAHDPEDPESVARRVDFGLHTMTLLAIATSIDAFAAGIMLPMLDAPLVLSIATIGLTTALVSTLGLYAGHRAGHHLGELLGKRLDIAGGLILIGMGLMIFVDHEFFGGGVA